LLVRRIGAHESTVVLHAEPTPPLHTELSPGVPDGVRSAVRRTSAAKHNTRLCPIEWMHYVPGAHSMQWLTSTEMNHALTGKQAR
jgi:hypothetical protein